MRIAIHYCPQCGWMLRSAWLAQELLTTFANELTEVALCPANQPGTFAIYADDQLLWRRQDDGGFPQAKQIKQRLRDRVAPGKSLGHNDR